MSVADVLPSAALPLGGPALPFPVRRPRTQEIRAGDVIWPVYPGFLARSAPVRVSCPSLLSDSPGRVGPAVEA